MAAASVDITPHFSVPLAGYPGRHGSFSEIADALEANVLVLRNGADTVVFVSLDLLYAGTALRKSFESACRSSVAPEALVVAASHTHFAPATDSLLPRLGQFDAAYVSSVESRVGGLLAELLSRVPEPVTLQSYRGRADHSINRRLSVFGLGRDFPFMKTRCEMRPNRNGPRDETIRVIRFANEGGVSKAVCWSYACHPVGFPHTDHVSADFPGVVRSALRARFGDIPILYLQGFSGDTRPCCPAPAYAVRGARFRAFDDAQWNAWSSSLAERVVAVAAGEGETLVGTLQAKRRTFPLRAIGPDAQDRTLSVQRIAVGKALDIVGVSAEMVSAYTLPLLARFGPSTIPVGCLDGVPGYIPTSEMVAQGGYEASGFMPLFGVSGRYCDDVSARVSRLLFDEVA